MLILHSMKIKYFMCVVKLICLWSYINCAHFKASNGIIIKLQCDLKQVNGTVIGTKAVCSSLGAGDK